MQGLARPGLVWLLPLALVHALCIVGSGSTSLIRILASFTSFVAIPFVSHLMHFLRSACTFQWSPGGELVPASVLVVANKRVRWSASIPSLRLAPTLVLHALLPFCFGLPSHLEVARPLLLLAGSSSEVSLEVVSTRTHDMGRCG